MADLYPNIRFPSPDFSVIGDLPRVMDEAAGQRALKEGLSGLKSLDPEEMDKAATRILSNPNVSTAAIEQAMRLQAASTARREQIRKEKADVIYQQSIGPLQEMYSKILGGKGGAGGEPSGGETFSPFNLPGTAPPGGAPGGVPGAPLTVPTPAPAVPDYFSRPPGAIPGLPLGPQGALPMPQRAAMNAPPPAPPPPVTPPSMPPPTPLSPTNQMLAQAQAGVPALPQGSQLAGPPPTPDTAAPLPFGVEGARMGGVPAAPQAVPVAAPPREVPRTVPGLSPEVASKLTDLASTAATLGPRASPTQRAALMQTYNNLLEQTKWTPEVKQWQSERMDRFTRGEPDISLSDWKLFNSNSSQFIAEGLKTYEYHDAERKKADALKTDLDALGKIVKNPKFFSGTDSEMFTRGVNAVTTARDAALALGVPEGLLQSISSGLGLGPNMERITTPAQLQQLFTAISNQAIYSKLGSLGNTISNSDRTFVQAANPSILMSKGANDVLIDMMSALAKRKSEIGDMLDKYRGEAGVRVNGPQMNQMIKRYNDDHPIFTDKNNAPNALGKRIMDASMPSTGIPGQAANAAASGVSNAASGIAGIPGRVISALTPSTMNGQPPSVGTVPDYTPPQAPPPVQPSPRALAQEEQALAGEPGIPPIPKLPTRAASRLPPSLNAPMSRAAAEETALTGQRPPLAEDLALAGEVVTSAHEGQIYYGPDNKRAGIIRDGRPVPFRRLNR